MFYRLFLTIEYESEDHCRFEIRVTPDREQAPRDQSIAMISCSTVDDLDVCLTDLGVTGWSHPVGESQGGLLSEYVPCSSEDLLERLKTAKPPSLTLIAADTSVQEMNQRVAVLTARGRPAIKLRVPA
jgi:hypothetical protein